jgi:hypothetical protein
VTGVTASNKVYDSTLTATLGGTAAVAPFAGDTVTVAGPGVGAFATKNVGTGIAVAATGFSLTGTNANDYTVVQPIGIKASILPVPVVLAATMTTQLESNTLSYEATTQPEALSLSPTIVVTVTSGPTQAARVDPFSLEFGNDVPVNVKMNIGTAGPRLEFANGGMYPPDIWLTWSDE